MIRAIAAVDRNFAIGYKNRLLFHCPEDKADFRRLTLDGIIIMGRKTFDSLPGPFDRRINWVITHRPKGIGPVSKVRPMSYTECLNRLYDLPVSLKDKIWVIGGSAIYNLFIKRCREVYLTQVDIEYPEVDSYFPRIDQMENWYKAETIKSYDSEGVKVELNLWKKN